MSTIKKFVYKQIEKMPLISLTCFHLTVLEQAFHANLLDFKNDFFNKIKTLFFAFLSLIKADLDKIIFINKKTLSLKNENGFVLKSIIVLSQIFRIYFLSLRRRTLILD
jgi:hypothetical protein